MHEALNARDCRVTVEFKFVSEGIKYQQRAEELKDAAVIIMDD